MHRVLVAVAIVIGLLSAGNAFADLRFASWNVSGGEKEPSALEANAQSMQMDIGPLDVLVVQEVISAEQVQAITRGVGLPHWVISDLAPPVGVTGAWPRSLEVAVISRIPVEAAAEWDITGSGPVGDGFPPRASSDAIRTEELDLDVTFGEN